MEQSIEEIKARMYWLSMEDMQESHPYLEFGWDGFIMIAFDRAIFMADEIVIGDYL